MSEKLCLQWNDFQDNVKSAFENLRESTDFSDVTLACEDGHSSGWEGWSLSQGKVPLTGALVRGEAALGSGVAPSSKSSSSSSHFSTTAQIHQIHFEICKNTF